MANPPTQDKRKNLKSMFEATSNRTSVTRLHWSDIEPREQSRKVFQGISELAESIEASGQLQPIIVAPIEGRDGKFTIIVGERRWRACQELNIKVDAIIRPATGDVLRDVAIELVENIQRENLAPTEVGHALQRLVDQGYSQTEIAKAIGRSKQYVSSHRSLVELPGCVQALANARVTRDGDTLNYLRKLHEIDPKKAEAECSKALDAGISRHHASSVLKKARQPPAQPPEKNKPENTSDGKAPIPDQGSGVIRHSREGWSQVPRGSMSIRVSFPVDPSSSEHRTGILMNDRVDDDPDYLWVLCARGRDSGYEAIRVSADKLTIMGAETAIDE